MDLDQVRRLEDTTALVDVFEDREDLVLRQVARYSGVPLRSENRRGRCGNRASDTAGTCRVGR